MMTTSQKETMSEQATSIYPMNVNGSLLEIDSFVQRFTTARIITNNEDATDEPKN